MFTNTAYESLYMYLGLYLHSASIDIITSQQVFAGLLLLTFGVVFFVWAWKYFSSFMPGSIAMGGGGKSLFGPVVKILACLFMGIALLKVQTTTTVKKFDDTSWHHNNYIKKQIPNIDPNIKVSFFFDVLDRSAEEVFKFFGGIVDKLFSKTNSEQHAPAFFYKAIMYSGSQHIEDPRLRKKVGFYTRECFEKILPMIEDNRNKGNLDLFFSDVSEVNQALDNVVLKKDHSGTTNCLDIRNEVRTDLRSYASKKFNNIRLDKMAPLFGDEERFKNQWVSSLLVNYYLQNNEEGLGLQKGTIVPTTGGKILTYLRRFFSIDGALHATQLFGNMEGAIETAERSKNFNEQLKRAPHIAGIVKMFLILIFPWLVFFVVAGKWKVIVYWYAVYASVLSWPVIWTLFYHIMTGLALSTDVMEAYGRLSDGISLYSSQLITSRIYNFYSVYSWIQVFVGPILTASVAYILTPLLRDTSEEHLPSYVNQTTSTVKKVL